jgi:hypothetical protein
MDKRGLSSPPLPCLTAALAQVDTERHELLAIKRSGSSAGKVFCEQSGAKRREQKLFLLKSRPRTGVIYAQ